MRNSNKQRLPTYSGQVSTMVSVYTLGLKVKFKCNSFNDKEL